MTTLEALQIIAHWPHPSRCYDGSMCDRREYAVGLANVRRFARETLAATTPAAGANPVWTVVGQYPTGDTFVEYAAAPTPTEAGRQAVAQINARNDYDYDYQDIVILAVFHGEQRDCQPGPSATLGLGLAQTDTPVPPANADEALAALTALKALIANLPANLLAPTATESQRCAALGTLIDWWNQVGWPAVQGRSPATLYTVIIVSVEGARVDYEVQLSSSLFLLSAVTDSQPYQDAAGWLTATGDGVYAVAVPTAITLTTAQNAWLARLRARLAEMDCARAPYQVGSLEYDELYAEQNEALAGELRSWLAGLFPD